MLAKTDKAVILHKLEENVSVQTVQILKEDIHIIDGNVLLHSLHTIPQILLENWLDIFLSAFPLYP